MKYSIFVTLTLALAAAARPKYFPRADFTAQNGKDATALNNKFKTLSASSSCTSGENACIDNKFAQCVSGKFVTQSCGGGLICAALPLVNSPGTSVTCTTASDRDARIAATGASGSSGSGNNLAAKKTTSKKGSSKSSSSKSSKSSTSAAAAAATSAATADNAAAAGAAAGAAASATNATSSAAASSTAAAASGDDAQSSLTLLSSVVATGFANDGQAEPTAGQVASLTSTNNFINFCATNPAMPITNGLQIKSGSCNPAPMGMIPSTASMPSSKFVFPKNGGSVSANKNFTIQMRIQNIETGNFVNADENYYAAPQQLNSNGTIIGHTHVVVEAISALDTTDLTDPTTFAFFKGVNTPAVNGVVSADVTGGLPKGTYRLASINAAMNHQPVLVAVAQHGSLDDMVYFTVN